jgi:glutamate/aspartate transport system substrate-binding protein
MIAAYRDDNSIDEASNDAPGRQSRGKTGMSSLQMKILVIFLGALLSLHSASAGDSTPMPQKIEGFGPTLQKIKDTGAITLGYRENSIPMSYANAQQPMGFALDLCALIAGKVKEKLGLPELETRYKAVAQADAASLLKNGDISIDCAVTGASGDLAGQAGFSNPIFVSELKWIVPRRLRIEREGRYGPRYETVLPSTTEDLRGKPVALTKGAGVFSLVLSLSSDRSLGLSILEGKDNAESFKLLETGKASAFLADDVLLVGLKAGAKNPEAYGFLSDTYPGTSYALMIAKDDKEFKELADAALSAAMKSGEYAGLYTKWFESPIPPKNVNLAYPMPDKLKELVKAAGEKAAGQ